MKKSTLVTIWVVVLVIAAIAIGVLVGVVNKTIAPMFPNLDWNRHQRRQNKIKLTIWPLSLVIMYQSKGNKWMLFWIVWMVSLNRHLKNILKIILFIGISHDTSLLTKADNLTPKHGWSFAVPAPIEVNIIESINFIWFNEFSSAKPAWIDVDSYFYANIHLGSKGVLFKHAGVWRSVKNSKKAELSSRAQQGHD